MIILNSERPRACARARASVYLYVYCTGSARAVEICCFFSFKRHVGIILYTLYYHVYRVSLLEDLLIAISHELIRANAFDCFFFF